MYNKLIDMFKTFISINEEEKHLISNLFREKHYKKDEWFISEGKVCNQVGFVVKGLLYYYWNDDGEVSVFEFGREGDFVTNYESCIYQTPSDINIQFLEDTVLLVITYSDLNELFERLNEGERFGRLILEHLFIERIKAISSFYRHTPEGRYERFLDIHTNLPGRVPQYLIASYIGVKPQSLSRIKQRMGQDSKKL